MGSNHTSLRPHFRQTGPGSAIPHQVQNLGPISKEAGGTTAGPDEGSVPVLPIASQSVGLMRSTPRSGFDEWKAGEVFGATAGLGAGGGDGTGRGSEISAGS